MQRIYWYDTVAILSASSAVSRFNFFS